MKEKGKINSGIKFILPGLVGVSIFTFLPYADVLRRSFFHTGSQSFAGLENYKDVIHNEAFQLAAKNTGVFIGVCIPLLMMLSLALALFIYENPRTESFLKTGFLIPMAIPVASVVLMWKFLFENRGIINGLLVDLGLSPVNWMDSNAAFWILVGSYIWKNLGYNIILWLASLSAVNPALREAAMLDGAGFWQRFYYVFFPQLKKAAFVIIVLAVLNSFKVFREAYLVAGDYPWENIYFIQHCFNNWFRDLAIDKIAAAAVLNSVILMALVLLLQRCWDKERD